MKTSTQNSGISVSDGAVTFPGVVKLVFSGAALAEWGYQTIKITYPQIAITDKGDGNYVFASHQGGSVIIQPDESTTGGFNVNLKGGTPAEGQKGGEVNIFAGPGASISLVGGTALAGDDNGGDIIVAAGNGAGVGQKGSVYFLVADEDPYVAGAAWWNNGVLTKSAG